MSPEIYEETGHGFEVDWWAVGVIIFELMFGNTPFFSKMSVEKIQKKIKAAKVIFPDRKKYPHLEYSDELEDLVRKLLLKD